MKDINSVTMTGRLTADPVFRSTQGGYSFLNFTIACNASKKDGDTWVDEAHFFDCEISGKRAEGLNGKLLKGEAVTIHGRLRLQRWEAEGQKKSRVSISIDDIVKQYAKKTDNTQVVNGPKFDELPAMFGDDDLPF